VDAKKGLGQRIRGWFPQEPRIHVHSIKTINKVKPTESLAPFQIRMGETTIRIINSYGLLAGFWTAYVVLSIFQSINFISQILPFQILGWIIGLVVGSIIGGIHNKRLLNQLAANHQTDIKKDWIVLAISSVAFALLGVFIGTSLYIFNSPIQAGAIMTVLTAFLGLIIAFTDSRVVSFFVYEKRHGMLVMQYFGRTELFEIPREKPSAMNTSSAKG